MTRLPPWRRALVLVLVGGALLVGCAAVRSYVDAVRQIERLGCASVGIGSTTLGDGTAVTVSCTTGLREPAAVLDLQVAVLRVVWQTVPGTITSLRADLRTPDGAAAAPPLVLSGQALLLERLGPRDPELDSRRLTDGAGRLVAAALGGLLLAMVLAAVLVVVLVRRSRARAAVVPVAGWGLPAANLPGPARSPAAWSVPPPPLPPPPAPAPAPSQQSTGDVWRPPG